MLNNLLVALNTSFAAGRLSRAEAKPTHAQAREYLSTTAQAVVIRPVHIALPVALTRKVGLPRVPSCYVWAACTHMSVDGESVGRPSSTHFGVMLARGAK